MSELNSEQTAKLLTLCKNPNQPDVATTVAKLRDAISKGADVNTLTFKNSSKNDDTPHPPILLACENDADPQFLQTLLDAGASPNIPGGNTGVWTPLSWLAHTDTGTNIEECMTILIKSDSLDPNFKDPEGFTYLYDLYYYKDALLDLIKTKGYRMYQETLDARCFRGNTSLLLRCCKSLGDEKNIEIIKALLDVGADPNITGDGDEGEKNEWTPLSWVGNLPKDSLDEETRLTVLRLFINSDKLNPNIEDNYGYTYLYDLYKHPHALLEFLDKKKDTLYLSTLNTKCFDAQNTLLMEYCNLITRMDEDTARIYHKLILKLVSLGVELNYVNSYRTTALDYLDRAIPDRQVDTDDRMRGLIHLYDVLSSNGAMTYQMVVLTTTPVIKRNVFASNSNSKESEVVSMENVSPSQIRNAFIRNWAHLLPRPRLEGGRRKTRSKVIKRRKTRKHH